MTMTELPFHFDGSVLPIIFSLFVTLGASYIFYPAINVWVNVHLSLLDQEDLYPEGDNCDSANENFIVHLSVVIPAYNEEERLPVMLNAALDAWNPHSVDDNKLIKTTLECCALLGDVGHANVIGIEWIVVNDGSSDATTSAFRDYVRRKGASTLNVRHRWKLVSLRKNGGKGAAVRAGMLSTSGHLCLMVDADGATEFGVGLQSCLDALLVELKSSCTQSRKVSAERKNITVFGSRAHMENESIAKRSLVRTILMHVFHFFVSVLCSSQVRDSQCGFKLFPQGAARVLFGNLHLMRWAFDTEILVLAELEKMKILEVAVPWQEVDGSKLNTGKLALALVSIGMLRDMLCVRLCYTFGIWKLSKR